ncbi:HpcH/HpaI aldolase family protein [Maricaulis maris]|uniref:HpcH/HpaI aldolase family protein n=1 Tax=Maricaulis maris TaxID=74318 RepID=UPI003A8D69F2
MTFHDRLKQGSPLLATFVKTPHPMVIEVLGGTALDALILDCEHSPFGWADIDRAVLAARAVGKPILARLPDDQPTGLLKLLDMGADGVVVPHVSTARQARDIVRAAHYGDGGRGFATTTRAGGYGRLGMKEHLDASAAPTILVQIEDPAAVDNIDDIVAVPGISGVFIGPADLAIAYGVNDLSAPRVIDAMTRVIASARKAALPVACFTGSSGAVKALYDRGVTLVALASEHTAIQSFFSDEALAPLRARVSDPMD